MSYHSQNILKTGVCLGTLLLALAGCGGASTSSTSSSSPSQQTTNHTLATGQVSTTLGEMNLGSAAPIVFSGGQTSQTIHFDGLTGNEEFILTSYSPSKTAVPYSVVLAGTPQSTSAHAIVNSLSTAPDPLEGANDATGAFHQLLRTTEEGLSAAHALDPQSNRVMTSTSRPPAVVGEVRSVKVLNSLSNTESYTVIQAKVKMVTPHFVVMLDESVSDVLSDEEIQTMILKFEEKVDAEYAIFGNLSDIDGDGKANVVFTPVLNQLGGGQGIVTGFFFAGDLFPETYSASNNGEFIYCHVPDDSGDFGPFVPKDFYLSNTGPNCLPHELQHAINFNMKVFENGGAPDTGPFNEGQSHLAEDLYNDLNTVSAENPSRVQLCLNAKSPTLMRGTALADRGCSYLFYRYLYEQADLQRFSGIHSGKELLYKIHNSKLSDFAAIESVLQEPVETIVQDFFTALYLSNTGLTANTRHTFQGINLRALQQDGRSTLLSGPTVATVDFLPNSYSVGALSTQYAEISGQTLVNAGGQLTIELSSAASSGFVLIRVK